jgi:transposase
MKENIDMSSSPDSGGTKKRVKRVFDEQFRRDAVALPESTGEPLSKIAVQLGVTHWNLRDWIKAYGRKSVGGASPAGDLRQVIVRLQQENDTLRAERDVLKKAMGILATPKPSGTR